MRVPPNPNFLNVPGRLLRLSRRRFLHTAGVMAGGVLAACAGAEPSDDLLEDVVTATPVTVLESPAAPEPAPTVARELGQFLALSAVLTGMPNLDLRLGQVYWESLQANPELPPLSALLERAGLVSSQAEPTLEVLRAAGIFQDEALRRLAGEITKMWYTGTYTLDGEPAVAAYTDALAWKTLRFTKPATICGSFGFWATRPPVEVPPSSGPVAPALE